MAISSYTIHLFHMPESRKALASDFSNARHPQYMAQKNQSLQNR